MNYFIGLHNQLMEREVYYNMSVGSNSHGVEFSKHEARNCRYSSEKPRPAA